MITLLVCPFCGIEPTIESWHGGPTSKRRIGCSNDACHVAPSVTGDTELIAVERWNTRALAAEVEKLREVARAAQAYIGVSGMTAKNFRQLRDALGK